jgi:predicted ArsR family transcriptional regulator
VKTSRQRLLDYVQTHQPVSAVEIGLALHMTGANARHHLSILEEQGRVEMFGQRKPKGKGRPTNLYSLSEKVRGQNLDKLAHALLKEMLGGLPQEEQGGALQRIADRMSEGTPTEAARKTNRTLTRRLNDTIRFLNDQNYLARWEAHAESPHLIFGNCPYAAILSDHPELCQIDVHLLESLLDSPVELIARLERDPRGAPHCVFMVGKP